MERMERKERGRGNTDSRPLRPLQHTYWCFTWNYDTSLEPQELKEEMERIFAIFHTECEWYVCQEEKGQSGNIHMQGTLKTKKPSRLTQMKKIHETIHWEPTKSIKSSIAYCTKSLTRCGNQWTYGINIPKDVTVKEPYGWQLQIMDIIKTTPDDRTIHWFWEPIGNVGKTSLCKFLCVKHNALILSGKSTDMFHLISKYPQKRSIIIFDVPRHSFSYINYAALESIKNGLICSGKYDGSQILFDCPHVIVFANEPPDLSAMSIDRWNVVRI